MTAANKLSRIKYYKWKLTYYRKKLIIFKSNCMKITLIWSKKHAILVFAKGDLNLFLFNLYLLI